MLKGGAPTYKFFKQKAGLKKICLPVILSTCFKCASQLGPLIRATIVQRIQAHRGEVTSQFPCKVYLSVYTSCKSAKAEVEVWAGQQVSGDQLFMPDLKQMFICQQNVNSHAFLLKNL